MRLQPAIPVMPMLGYADVLDELALGVRAGGTLVRKSASEVLDNTAAAIERTARRTRAGLDDVAPAQRRFALDSAEHFTLAAADARAGAEAIRAAATVRPWGHEVAGAPHQQVLDIVRQHVRRGAELLDRVDAAGTPAWRESTLTAAETAQVRAARRAKVAADIEPRLDEAMRAEIARHGPSRGLRSIPASPAFAKLIGMDVIDAANLTSAGPNVLFAPVHAGLFDQTRTLTGHAMPMRSMAVDWLLKTPGVGHYVRHLGAFPVTHGNSARSLDIARGVLADEQTLRMFPSGLIPFTQAPMPARTGFARLAIDTGTPVVPAGEYMTGPARNYGLTPMQKLMQGPHRSAIAYGEAIPTAHLDPRSEHDVIALAAHVEQRQKQLSQLAREHVAAARAR